MRSTATIFPPVSNMRLPIKMVKAELEGFAKAVSERFGERTFLGIAVEGSERQRPSSPSRQG